MIEKLPEIEGDKANHFIYGLLIYFISALIFGNFIGLSLCLIAAFGKEVYDHLSPLHKWCWWDLLWTLMGGLIGFLIRVN
jgi:hypothetical protein